MTYSTKNRLAPWCVPSPLSVSTLSAIALVMVSATAFAQASPQCPPGAFCEETPADATPPASDSANSDAADSDADSSDAAGSDANSPDDTGASEPNSAASEAGASEVGASEVEEGEGTSAKEGPVTVVLPPSKDPTQPRTFTYHPDPAGGPGQVVIYEGGDRPPHLAGEKVQKRVRRTRERRTELARHRRWGMNLRVEGALLPQYHEDAANDTGMAGLGLSLRYRPTPMFALDFAADFLGGVDANGLERQEIPLALSAMIYANPRNVVQFYMMGGMNWSFARVFSDTVQPNLREGTQDDYTYFGGHAGLGLEFRVSKLVGINVDGLGFIRTRTDDDGDGAFPEYYDRKNGEISNSSAGGLLRAGVTFWW